MPGDPNGLEIRRRRRLLAALAEEERAGLERAIRVRCAAMVLIVCWLLLFWSPFPVLYPIAIAVVFALLGIAQLAIVRSHRYRSWHKFLFSALDIAVVTYAIVMPNPLDPADVLPPALAIRFPTFPYYYLLLAFATFTFSAGLVLWTGVVTVIAWAIGVAWIIAQPGSLTFADFTVTGPEDMLAMLMTPTFVDVRGALQNGFVFLIVAGSLAVVVRRSRRIVMRQAAAERERANLARYFSPNVVDDLARFDEPLGGVRTQPVSVLFIDIVGFTTFCESHPPTEVIQLLRDFHARVERAIFAHDGTIDKFIGDCVMATFGTPRPGPRDATNALECARSLAFEVASWSAARIAAGRTPVAVGIGVHYGQAVLGDIGGERRVEFTVIGDTVNVASRLEALSRSLGVQIAASDAVIQAARREQASDRDPFPDFVSGPLQSLRGREETIAVRTWTLPDTGAAAQTPVVSAAEPVR